MKWLVIGGAIGVVAGLGALLFSHAIAFCTRFFLGDLVGYMPPMPVGEGEPVLRDIARPWALPLVTMLGALLSGIIVARLAPEAEGHGTDAATDAIHHKRAELRARIPPIKLVASAITIGSGGSGGREGPAAQISAGFGSLLATWLRLGAEERRIAVAAGMGAGIGAIFRAPLGGALMAAEILYLHDLEVEVLIPALIASIVGYSVFGYFEGFEPIFGAQPDLGFSDPVTLVYYAGLGIVAGLGGLLYARCFYGTARLFHRLRAPLWLKPAIGGLLVGLLALWIRGAIHTGYGWVQIGMTDELKTLPLWVVVALPFAKIVATSFSIGSGGSGGIFGPGMVIGGMLGAAAWRLGDCTLPHMPHSPAPFVIVGMMALFGSIAHAPFAVMLMVAEMTGNLSLLAPAMVAVAVATALVGDHTIYDKQLPDRAHSPIHRIRMSFPLLSALSVRDAMATPALVGGPAADAVTVTPREPLDVALQRMADVEATRAVVVESGATVGELTNREALAAYKTMLQRGVRRARALPASSLVVEGRLRDCSPVAGRTLREAPLPPGTLVVAIKRQGETLFPHADTAMLPGDVVTALTPPEQVGAVHAMLAGRERAPASDRRLDPDEALDR
ncbi:MAG TPA: chloride channel protein [Thermomicrobiales bacterium]|nr:chloride channel protein [Thermomicrobiales bacterium]